ncbi:hypothetical protein [Sulfitobacter guttiformis]|uniref:Uncharacterized protein n=1 Tax=Sulfitobacter guttiformis TaxID=74349 RepID=A0A420DP38_9RHOB|nr:hypothetical protein [Sulfitobacter guttiformis]RKE95938.1 hypothetical protein C8N30_0485 [Sulfitobacter guttiformis]
MADEDGEKGDYEVQRVRESAISGASELFEADRKKRFLNIERNRAFLSRPRFGFGKLVLLTNVKPATLRTWLTRKQLSLDADQNHSESKWRLFSYRDAVRIASLASISSDVRVSVTDATEILELLIRDIEQILENNDPDDDRQTGDLECFFAWKEDEEWRAERGWNTRRGMMGPEFLPATALFFQPHMIFKQVFADGHHMDDEHE